MKELFVRPTIWQFDTAAQFAEEFHLGKGDLVITNQYIYEPYFGKLNLSCDVLYQEKYGAGEPSDDMAHEYGVMEEDLEAFTDSVLANQQRLLANNFVPLDRDRIYKIYKELY